MPKSAARYLFIVTCALLVVAFNVQAGWLFVLVFFLVAFMIAAWLFPFFWTRGNLFAEGFVPSVFEGDWVEVVIRIANMSRFNRYFLIVEDVFSAKEKPERVSLFLPFLARGQTTELAYRTRAERRGIYQFKNLLVRGLGPAGFFEWKRKLVCKGKVIVYPVSQAFPFSLTEGAQASFQSDTRFQSGRGDSEEFYGVRPHETGESLRSIHWPSSAKTGRLMTRDMMQSRTSLYTIYLDCDKAWAGANFEMCVKLTLYAAQEILQQGNQLRFFYSGVAEPKDWAGSLLFLAAVQPVDDRSLCEQMKACFPLLSSQRRLVFFTAVPATFSERSWEFAEQLAESSASLQFIFFQQQSDEVARKLSVWFHGKGIPAMFLTGEGKQHV